MNMVAEDVYQLNRTGDENQYLTFLLDDEYYGLEILRVQEIRGWTPVTNVPNTPAYIKGVLNLRGAIVPIIDMRERFHLELKPYSNTTVVIVASVQSESGQKTFGMVVDGVSDVLDLPADQIKPSPDFGTAIHTDFIRGLAASDDQMVMLLDIDLLLNSNEIETVTRISDQSTSEVSSQ
jgi:purine-binding chemotaxis protein CheW